MYYLFIIYFIILDFFRIPIEILCFLRLIMILLYFILISSLKLFDSIRVILIICLLIGKIKYIYHTKIHYYINRFFRVCCSAKYCVK